MATLIGKSCMVDCIIGPTSPVTWSRSPGAYSDESAVVLGDEAASCPEGGTTSRSRPSRRSTPVVHARVTHREHQRLLVELEPAVDDLAEEQRVAAELDRLAHLAVDERDGLIEDRCPGGAVVEREAVEGARGEIDVDRLGELADDRPIVLRDQVHAEHAAVDDELVGERLALDADADQLRLERQLRDPVDGHPVAPLPRA